MEKFLSGMVPAGDSTAAGRGDTQLVTMRVGGRLFGLPILEVRNIVTLRDVAPVPLAPAAIAGVMNQRGRTATVVDLGRILGVNEEGREAPGPNSKGITIDHQGSLYVLRVDAVGEIYAVGEAARAGLPSTLDPTLKRLCAGIYRLRDEVLLVLDAARVLDPETIWATPVVPFLPRLTDRQVASEWRNDRKSGSKRRRRMHRRRGARAVGVQLALPPAAAVATEAPPIAEAHGDRQILSVGPAPPIRTGALHSGIDPNDIGAAPRPVSAPSVIYALGGKAGLAKFAEAFYARVVADPVLVLFFAEADMARQRERLVALLDRLLSPGSVDTVSRTVRHDWLVPVKAMDDDGFTACLGHFESILAAMGIPEKIGDKVLAALERCREGVVD